MKTIVSFFLLSYSLGCFFCSAQELAIDSTLTQRVDSIITSAITKKAFPGAQVLVSHQNKTVFHKAYGYHTYDSLQGVNTNDIYDLASVTKIIGPLPALMKLVDEGKIDLDAPFSTYWRPWRKRRDKKEITLREILSHQAGLVPYIVFLQQTMKNGQFKSRFLRNKQNRRFEKKAFEGLYVKNRFENKMYRIINRSKVSEEKKYRYSGLTFLIFPKLIEQLSGKPYDQYLQENFYGPLGCQALGFNPMEHDYQNQIVPTEVDTLFRNATVKGFVHDENAALLGGISGNAGLFGTASDLEKVMLLYQNYGEYRGQRFISRNTIKEFINVQYPENENRRGLGFDKPYLGNDTLPVPEAYPSPRASKESFGHSGFTGTFVWADPKKKLVFIFLSNRVFPNRSHRNLYELNVRTVLHDLFYNAFE